MNIENFIESQYRRISGEISEEFVDLYQSVTHSKLKTILATLHSKFVSLFDSMNSRLPTGSEYGAHFWADPSRELIKAIEIAEGLQKALKTTPLAFNFDEYYQGIIAECNEFLSASGGSSIPPGMNKIELYYTIPVFIMKNSISVNTPNENKFFELKLIGEGSYAFVFKYTDEFYKKEFVLKRAKKDLNEKELARFKQEFDQMKALNSPYVVEVYCYNDVENQYIMEFMDLSLDDYIKKNNSKLTSLQRKNICLQIVKAFDYINSKGLLHRDISPKNILIKKYENILVVKIADFGLVKAPNSILTSVNSEYKGYFNDPELAVEGFKTYNILHETYALTRILYFVLTGKTNTSDIKNSSIKVFIDQGLNPDKTKRYKGIDELLVAFKRINL